MALDHKGVHPTTPVDWRKRLAKSQRPQRINYAVPAVVAETGMLRGGVAASARNSIILADAVATQDTITQSIAAIPRVGRLVPYSPGSSPPQAQHRPAMAAGEWSVAQDTCGGGGGGHRGGRTPGRGRRRR
ncbi:MAG: hypothetical protein PHQ28_13795 [Mycobacterium sp.]|nr:hypothetical protein [Mycobacterium sp.]